MVKRDPVQSLTQDFISGDVSRRVIHEARAALGSRPPPSVRCLVASPSRPRPRPAAAAYTPELIAARAAAQVAEVPREETLVAVRSRHQGKFTDELSGTRSCPPANHQLGSHMMYEPLAFYSAFADKSTMWLAESYEYSDDYMTLTVKTRPSVTWSDGEPSRPRTSPTPSTSSSKSARR